MSVGNGLCVLLRLMKKYSDFHRKKITSEQLECIELDRPFLKK